VKFLLYPSPIKGKLRLNDDLSGSYGVEGDLAVLLFHTVVVMVAGAGPVYSCNDISELII